MSDKRKLYRVIMKILTLVGVGIILWVFLNSVFVTNHEKQSEAQEHMEVSLKQLDFGEITHVNWNGKKVSILNTANATERATFFVFYDVGDSGNCPLFFNGEILKDTCTGTVFNQQGESITKGRSHTLQSPPYYFKDQFTLVFG